MAPLGSLGALKILFFFGEPFECVTGRGRINNSAVGECSDGQSK